MSRSALLRTADSGDENRAFGFPRRFKIEAAETDGAFSVFSEEIPPGQGPPMHVHHREHETFVVLVGRVRFHCSGDEGELAAGGVAMIPPGAPHTFKNVGDETARVIVTLTPGGAEEFFKRVEAEGLRPPEDMPRIAEIAAEHGLEFVGPPLD